MYVLLKILYKITGGGYNSIIATMKAVQLAFDTDQFERFILIQGADYPLYSPAIIHDFFERHASDEFCKCRNISEASQKKDYMKWAGFYCNDVSKRNIPAYIFSRVLNRFNMFGLKYRKSYFINDNGNKWHIFHGWAHFALTKDCMQYIYEVYKNDFRFNNFMKHRFPPDEIYIQTIVANSSFASRISEYKIKNRNTGKESNLNLTYFEYPKFVTYFTQPDELAALKKTGALFVRKVNSKTSESLLNRIDAEKEILVLNLN